MLRAHSTSFRLGSGLLHVPEQPEPRYSQPAISLSKQKRCWAHCLRSRRQPISESYSDVRALGATRLQPAQTSRDRVGAPLSCSCGQRVRQYRPQPRAALASQVSARPEVSCEIPYCTAGKFSASSLAHPAKTHHSACCRGAWRKMGRRSVLFAVTLCALLLQAGLSAAEAPDPAPGPTAPSPQGQLLRSASWSPSCLLQILAAANAQATARTWHAI